MEENNKYRGQSTPRVENSARQRAEAIEYLRREAEHKKEIDAFSKCEREAGEARMREHADLLARAEARVAEASNSRRVAEPGRGAEATRNAETSKAAVEAQDYSEIRRSNASVRQDVNTAQNSVAATREKRISEDRKEAALRWEEYEPIRREAQRSAPKDPILPENARKDEKSDTPPARIAEKDMTAAENQPKDVVDAPDSSESADDVTVGSRVGGDVIPYEEEDDEVVASEEEDDEVVASEEENDRAREEERRRMIEWEDRLVAEELRRLKEKPQDPTQMELDENKRRQNERKSAIMRAMERDALVIGLRNEYSIAYLEAERDILNNSFSFDEWKKSKEKRNLARKISKIKRSGDRALSREREDNDRYYMLFLMEGEESVKKRASREKLDALKVRLEILLSEREDINNRLIALYGGADKDLDKVKVDRKASKVRKKHAKAMYRRQRHLAAKIARYNAPADIKEKALNMLNKKTRSVALLEESNYKLRHLRPEGRAKAELLGNIKRAKADIKSTESDLKYIMKKLKRNHKRKSGESGRVAALLGLILIVAIVGAVVYFFGDKLYEYFKPIFGAIKGR